MATTISPIFNKTLFQRLLNSRKLNTEIIYFDKTTTENGESLNKIFDVDDTIFYKPFEIEVNYDITNKPQPKNTIAFFSIICIINMITVNEFEFFIRRWFYASNNKGWLGDSYA